MRAKNRKIKLKYDPQNGRLDLFLKSIEESKQNNKLKFVKDLTFETLQNKTKPHLRLKN